MDPAIFERLTASELDRYTGELDVAMESHTRWLTQINRTLVCATPPDANDISETPHHRCQLGRWYHGVDIPELRAIPEFTAIADVHEHMHRTARALLLQGAQGQSVSAGDYDGLIALSEKLRELMHSVRMILKRSLHVAANLMGKVFESASEGIIVTNPDGNILTVNDAFTAMTGYPRDEILGRNPRFLQSGRHDPDFFHAMWESLRRDGQWQGEIWNRHRNGDASLQRLYIGALRDGNGEVTHYVAILSRLGSNRENEARLYRLAHYDMLTGLPNRLMFQDRLNQALAAAGRSGHALAVMFLDLDGFKDINDALGHAAGDALLQQFAARLRDHTRASDTLARFGGDEFTVLVPDVKDPGRVCRVADKIIAEARRPYRIDDGEFSVSTSLGISLYPDDGSDPETLVVQADLAMYEAKKLGKNRYCFYGETPSPAPFSSRVGPGAIPDPAPSS